MTADRIPNDGRPDVVYLRSFAAPLTAVEEQLADVLRPFGELVAIGRSGEAFDDEWRAELAARIATAPLVVVRAGLGEGLLWELEHTLRNKPPTSVLVMVHDLPASEYAPFRARAAERLGIALPELPRYGPLDRLFNRKHSPQNVRSGFIRFSPSWEPIFESLAVARIPLGVDDLRRPMSASLRAVFEHHRVPWRLRDHWT